MNSAFGNGFHHTAWLDPASGSVVAVLTNSVFVLPDFSPDYEANVRLEIGAQELLSELSTQR